MIGLGFARVEAQGVSSFGGTPSQELTDLIRRQFEGAKTSFEKAIALYQASGRKDGVATGYAQLGELYSKTTDYEEAQAAIGKALAINKDLKRKKEMAANYRALADTHRYDLDQAEVLLKEAVALDEAAGSKEGLAKGYEQLGAVSKSRGEPYEAEKFYKQALALTSRLEQGPMLKDLERLYRDRNDPGLAAEMKEQADALAKERGAGDRMVFSASLGLFQSSSGAKRQAETLEKVVPLEKKLGHWVGLATSYTLLGMHYAHRVESDAVMRTELEGRAEAMMREAVALNRTVGREPALAYTYRELIQIVDSRGNLAEVEATLKDAHALHKKLDREKEMARLYSSLGYARSKRGDSAQACEYWRKGAQTYPSERDLVDALNRNKCADTQ
jgi:tetratricopeptide (TPR) repeat protein